MALRSKAVSKTEYDSRPFIKSNLAGRSFCLGVMSIPCPHFKITIVKRSQGQSAVAGAAYQSGERLFSEYDQKTKFYNKKKELVHAEIMLPSHAPPGYADRATLWNAVEAVENQWNSQLARRIVLAFPVEVPKEQYLSMIKEFCQEQFVSKGMIADFAIHDKGDGNPHAHILLTLRAMDEHGRWLPKARKVYDLDENGERIQLPSGNWKCHKENTVDWNDQKYAEVWRHSWETITNRYLEAAGRPERVDLRSFERQGIQQIPTVHLGPAAHQMEKRGVETFLGNLNRDIRAANSLMQSIRSAIRGLQRWIADLNEKKQLLLDALEKAKEPTLSDLLVDYFNLRAEQRSDWSGKAKLKCTVRDFEEVKRAVDYLKAHSLNTVEDDLYRIPDGGVIQVDFPDGRSFTARVEHLDDYHFDMGGLGNVFHICQFAEVMERNHADFYPEIQTQDEQATWELGGKGYLAIQSCEDGWDYTLYHSDYSVMDGGQLDAPELTIQEAREQILEAHHMEKGRRLLQDYDTVMDKVAEAEERSADHRSSTMEKLAELASDTAAPKSSARSAPEL